MSCDPIELRADGTVVIRGEALPLLYRAVLALAIRHRHDGVSSPPLLREATRVLYRACLSESRHEDDERPSPEPSCNGQDGSWLSVAEDITQLARRRFQPERATHERC